MSVGPYTKYTRQSKASIPGERVVLITGCQYGVLDSCLGIWDKFYVSSKRASLYELSNLSLTLVKDHIEVGAKPPRC